MICFLVSDNKLIDFSEGYYLDFFQNNWEEEPMDDENSDVSDNEEEEEETLDQVEDDSEIGDTIEIILTNTYDELQMEPEYIEI